MIAALKTRKYRLIQQALRTDWRLRYYSFQEVQEVFKQVDYVVQINDSATILLIIEVFERISGFELNQRISSQENLQQIIVFYQQLTRQLLNFVRCFDMKDHSKEIILNSVQLIRRLIEYYPESQFTIIQQTALQYEKSSTLYISIMALIPHILVYNILVKSNQEQQILEFATKIIQKLPLNDWLSPLTNGFLSLYDNAFQISLLEPNKYFDTEIENYVRSVTSSCLPQFVNLAKIQANQLDYNKKNTVLLQVQKLGKLQVLEQLINIVVEYAGDDKQEVLQILTVHSTVFPSHCQRLLASINTLMTSGKMSREMYEAIFELFLYYLQKIQLDDQNCLQNTKNFVDIVIAFQKLLKHELLLQLSISAKTCVARIVGVFCKLRKYVIVSTSFLREILCYLQQCVSSQLCERPTKAQERAKEQLEHCTGISQLHQLYSTSPPQAPGRGPRQLVLAVLFAVHQIAANGEIPAEFFAAELITVLREMKVSTTSLFRFLATRLTRQLLSSSALSSENMEVQRRALETLLMVTVADPQWRCRYLLYWDASRDSNKYKLFSYVPENYEFPFLQQNALGADVQLPLQDQRYYPSFYRLITDVVAQIRSLGIQILKEMHQEWFGIDIRFFNDVALNFDGNDRFQQVIYNLINENLKIKVNTLTESCNNHSKYVLKCIHAILLVLQYAQTEYMKEIFIHLSVFSLTVLKRIQNHTDQGGAWDSDLQRYQTEIENIVGRCPW